MQRIQVTGSPVFGEVSRDICDEFDRRYYWWIGGYRASVMDQTSWYVFTLLNLDSILITARPYYRLK